MSEQKILRTEVHMSMGLSLELKNPDGTSDWIKSNPGLTVEIGPGFPDDEMLHRVFNKMIDECAIASKEQIDLLMRRLEGLEHE